MRLEFDKIVGFITEIKLLAHHRTEDLDFFWKGKPLHTRKEANTFGEEIHYAKIAIDVLFDIGMKHLDCNRSRRHRRKGLLKDHRTERATRGFADSAGPKVGGRDKVMFEGCSIDLVT